MLNIYKGFVPVLILVVVFFGNGHAQVVYEHDFLVKVGDIAPDFTITETSGKVYKLSDLRGHVVMLQFTASWCSVCRKEMPHIENELWQPGKSLGLKVIGINRDEPLEKAIEFKQQTGVSYPMALDPGAEIFGIFALKQSGVTRNVVVDRTGRILFLSRLFRMDEFREMKQLIFNELKRETAQ